MRATGGPRKRRWPEPDWRIALALEETTGSQAAGLGVRGEQTPNKSLASLTVTSIPRRDARKPFIATTTSRRFSPAPSAAICPSIAPMLGRPLAPCVASLLDSVYIVNDVTCMPTVVQSCRIGREHAALLSKQAKRRQLEVSTLSSLYLKEKALEEEYPGIGFRDAVGGREAYVLGHRVAVWEVEDVYREAGSIAKTADYFRWPAALVRCALAYARQFTAEVRRQRESEVGA
jgi:hypothetical protein